MEGVCYFGFLEYHPFLEREEMFLGMQVKISLISFLPPFPTFLFFFLNPLLSRTFSLPSVAVLTGEKNLTRKILIWKNYIHLGQLFGSMRM